MSVLKNVENKIKLVTITCGLFLFGCIVISLGSMFTAGQMVDDAHKQIYVLDSNVPILVKQTPQDVTLDDKYIRYTIDKAMYLVDETGLAQYNALKEKGFYSTIMGTNMLFSIFCDSIKFNRDSLNFTYYGRQRIERRSTILWRQLVTAGQLKRVPRTENNPYGLLIVNWRTLLNKDLEERRKSEY